MRPALQLDFARAGLLDPRTVFTRASGAVVRRPGSGWREVPAGAPGFHHDTDGRLLGVPIEPARTNEVRNPRCAGAILGVVRDGAGTLGAGALPTNWSWTNSDNASLGATGLTLEVVGTTWPGGGDGIVLRLFGTTTTNNSGNNWSGWYLNFEGRGQIAGGTNRTWSTSCDLLTAGGSLSGLFANAVRLQLDRCNPSGQLLGGDGAWATYTSIPSAGSFRASFTRTFSVDPARVVGGLRFAWTLGQTIDWTFAIRFSQNEIGPYASLPILPPAGAPAASTRAGVSLAALLADHGLLPGLTSGTLFVSGRAPPAAVAAELFRLDDGTANNAVILRRDAGRLCNVETISGGVSQGSTANTAALADSADFRAAIGFAPDDVALSLNGAAPVLGTQVSPGVGLSRLFSSGAAEGLILSRVAYWPRRLPNAELQLLGA